MSGVPQEAASLPAPPADEGAVTFGSGGHQTFSGSHPDGVGEGTLKGWKRVQSKFEERISEQFCWLIEPDCDKGKGELAYYTGVKVSTHPKSKLVPFLKTIGAPVPTPDDARLSDKIVGTRVKYFLKNEDSTSRPGSKFPKIKEFLAA